MKTIQDVEANLVFSSKIAIVKVAKAIEENPCLIEDLFQLAISDRQPLAWRAAWVFGYMADCKSPLLINYLPRIISALLHLKHHGQLGSFFRVVSRSDFKVEEYGDLLDFSIDTLLKPTIRASHKFYSLDVLEKFAIQVPELKRELVLIVEEALPNFETEALKRKGNLWLQRMNS